MYFDRLQEALQRIRGYPPYEVFLELALLWIVVYIVWRFISGTRGARIIKAMALVLLVATPLIKLFTTNNQFERLHFLYGPFVTFAALTLVIVFQPELRRALVRLGEARLFRGGGMAHSRVVDEIVGAVSYLSRNKVGALIAIERNVGLEGVVEAGTPLDATVSRELLNTIFYPGSALHDMAVLIREDRIVSAGVQLPLAEGSQYDSDLGSRHRAAIGLTQESDAIVIVVSEERGTISIAETGRLNRSVTLESLRALLTEALGGDGAAAAREASADAAASGVGRPGPVAAQGSVPHGK